jgi:hypothetical protein
MTQSELKNALLERQSWNEQIRTQTTVSDSETKSVQIKRIERARKDYAFFTEYYFPHICTNRQTGKTVSSAKFHVDAAKHLLRNRNARAVFQWARGHAKSTHMGVFIPLWLKCQKEREIRNMIMVGKSEDAAIRLLSDLRSELEHNNRYIHDFGKQIKRGYWAENEFNTADGTHFLALGRGQSPRGLKDKGNRPDYILIDDIDDDELCQNQDRVSKLTNWVMEALFGSLGGDGGRFVMVGNLISKSSVLYNLSQNNAVHITRVNITDKNGNPSWTEMWSPEAIAERQQFMGYRSFQREYMNNPITEGAVFKFNWIKWKKLPKLEEYERIVAYCDPSFKNGAKNDYKAIKVWGKKGSELHNIRNFVRQCSTTEMVRWFYNLHETIPEYVICDYYMEANFMQDMILDEFTVEGQLRGYQLPIRADHRKKPDKFQRIEAISPLWERGFVWYNADIQNDRDTLTGLEQLLAVEKGSRAHDDAPDADEGAIYILQKHARNETFKPVWGMRHKSENIW